MPRRKSQARHASRPSKAPTPEFINRADKPGAVSESDVLAGFRSSYWALHPLGRWKASGNGLYVFRAYQEYRRKPRQPLPESLLRILDQVVERLLKAHSANDVARALGVKTDKGGRAGAGRMASTDRQLDIVAHVDLLLKIKRVGGFPAGLEDGAVDRLLTRMARNKSAIYEYVADLYSTSPGHVKNLHRKWQRSQPW